MDEKGTQGRRTLRSPFNYGFTKDRIKAFKRHPKSRLCFNCDKATNFRSQLHKKNNKLELLSSNWKKKKLGFLPGLKMKLKV